MQVFGSHRFAVNGAATKAAFSTDGKMIARASLGEVTVWDFEGRQLAYLPIERHVVSVGFCAGDRLLVAFAPLNSDTVKSAPPGTPSVYAWRLPGFEPVTVPPGIGFDERRIAISARTPYIAISKRDYSHGPIAPRVRLYSTDSWEEVAVWHIPAERLHDMVFSPEGRELALMADDRIILQAVPPGAEPREVRIVRGVWGHLAYSLDGKHVAVSNGFGVSLRDRSLGDARYIRGPTSDAWEFARRQSGVDNPPLPPSRLVPPPIDEDTKPPPAKRHMDSSADSRRLNEIKCLAVSPDGSRVYCAVNFYDRRAQHPFVLEEYDVATRELRWIRSSVRDIVGIAPSPDGKRLLVWGRSYAHKLDLVPLETGKSEHPSSRFYDRDVVTLSRDGRSVARSAPGSRVEVWEVPGGRKTHSIRMPLPGGPVAFGGRGQLLTAFSNRNIHVLDTETEEVRTIPVADEEERVSGCAVSADGLHGFLTLRSLAGRLGRVRRYALPQWKLDAEAKIECEPSKRGWYGKQPFSVAASPDGKLVAVGTSRASVLVHDAGKLGLLHELACPLKPGGSKYHYVERLDFSPDGKLLAAATQDGLVYVWRAASGEKVHTLDAGASAGAVRFGPSGRRLLVGVRGVQVWDLASPEKHIKEIGLRTTVSSISEPVSSAGRTWIALGCSNGLAYLMKLDLPTE